MKSREQLTAQGFSFQWFSYAQLSERSKKVPQIEYDETEFENELCSDDEHVIAKMYILLFRFETKILLYIAFPSNDQTGTNHEDLKIYSQDKIKIKGEN